MSEVTPVQLAAKETDRHRAERLALARIWAKAEAMRGRVVWVGVKEKPCEQK